MRAEVEADAGEAGQRFNTGSGTRPAILTPGQTNLTSRFLRSNHTQVTTPAAATPRKVFSDEVIQIDGWSKTNGRLPPSLSRPSPSTSPLYGSITSCRTESERDRVCDLQHHMATFRLLEAPTGHNVLELSKIPPEAFCGTRQPKKSIEVGGE